MEFGRRQNHLRWGHRRSGLRLGVMEGHSDHQSGLLCVGSLGSEVSAPGPRVRVWYSTSETASHSSQSERLFLSRIATGRPWPLAKNRTFGRPTRRPSDAVAGAITPLLTSTCKSSGMPNDLVQTSATAEWTTSAIDAHDAAKTRLLKPGCCCEKTGALYFAAAAQACPG